MSCLGYEYYAFNNYMLPKLERKKENQENKPKKQERTMMDRMFGNSGRTKKYF